MQQWSIEKKRFRWVKKVKLGGLSCKIRCPMNITGVDFARREGWVKKVKLGGLSVSF
jgi:hypothetical protein